MTRDLRRYARQTNARLVLGMILLLIVVGGGLVYLIYGQQAAYGYLVCLLPALTPVVLAWLALSMVGWLAKRMDRDR